MNNLIEMKDGKATVTSLVIAEVFEREHKNVVREINSLISEGVLAALRFERGSYLDKNSQARPMLVLSEREALIAMPFIGGLKSKQGQVKLVDAFLALRAQHARPEPKALTQLDVAEVAARMLNMSDTSKIRMLTKACEIEGLSPAALPNYSTETLTRAATPLLKQLGSDLSAVAFNRRMIAAGLMVELERKGSRGQIKTFKSLTPAGLNFGKNETAPEAPRQTQPLYFVEKFSKLLGLLQ